MKFSKITLMALVAMDATNLASAETTTSLRGYDSLTRRKLGKVGRTYPEKSSQKSSKKCKSKEKAKGGSKGGSKAKSKAKSKKSGSEDGPVTEPIRPVPIPPELIPPEPTPVSDDGDECLECPNANRVVVTEGSDTTWSFDDVVEVSYNTGGTIQVEIRTLPPDGTPDLDLAVYITSGIRLECEKPPLVNLFDSFTKVLECVDGQPAFLEVCYQDRNKDCDPSADCLVVGNDTPFTLGGQQSDCTANSIFNFCNTCQTACYGAYLGCEECPEQPVTVPATPAPSSMPSSAPSSVPSSPSASPSSVPTCALDNLVVTEVGDAVTSFDDLVGEISYGSGEINVEVFLDKIEENFLGEPPTYYFTNGIERTSDCVRIFGNSSPNPSSQTLSCDEEGQAYLQICVEDATLLCNFSGGGCFFQGTIGIEPRGECDNEGYDENAGFPMTCYAGIFSCEECPEDGIIIPGR